MRHLLPRVLFAHLALCFGALTACSPKDRQTAGEPNFIAPAQVGLGQAPAAQAPAQPVGPPTTAVVLGTALVRRQPTDAKTVPVAGKKNRQLNWLATLYRGEAVQVRAIKDDWADAALSDESHGWIKQDGLLMGDALQLATTLSACRLFTRPDLLALYGNRTIDPGTLIVVLRQKEQFSEVNFGGQQSAWVLTAMLVEDAQEVGAAKLVHRARLLQQRRDPAVSGVLELLHSQFAKTRLVAALAAPKTPTEPAAADNTADNTAGGKVGSTPQTPEAPEQDPVPAASLLQLVPTPVLDSGADRGGAPGLQQWQHPAGAEAPSPPKPVPDDPFTDDLGPADEAEGVPDGVTGP